MTTHACLLTNDDNEYANLHTEDIKFLIYKILLFYYVFSFLNSYPVLLVQFSMYIQLDV